MINDNADLKTLHKAMQAIVAANDAAGWPSPEIEEATKRVAFALGVCVMNEPSETVMRLLGEAMAKLDAARGGQ
jgi:hypothetical protein